MNKQSRDRKGAGHYRSLTVAVQMDKNMRSGSGVVFTSLPGPTRKRQPSPYCYRLTYRNPHPHRPGCVLLWAVCGGREEYQIVLERDTSGKLRWHCTCADAVYRGEDAPHTCKHVRGLRALGRQPSAD